MAPLDLLDVHPILKLKGFPGEKEAEVSLQTSCVLTLPSGG